MHIYLFIVYICIKIKDMDSFVILKTQIIQIIFFSNGSNFKGWWKCCNNNQNNICIIVSWPSWNVKCHDSFGRFWLTTLTFEKSSKPDLKEIKRLKNVKFNFKLCSLSSKIGFCFPQKIHWAQAWKIIQFSTKMRLYK